MSETGQVVADKNDSNDELLNEEEDLFEHGEERKEIELTISEIQAVVINDDLMDHLSDDEN